MLYLDSDPHALYFHSGAKIVARIRQSDFTRLVRGLVPYDNPSEVTYPNCGTWFRRTSPLYDWIDGQWVRFEE